MKIKLLRIEVQMERENKRLSSGKSVNKYGSSNDFRYNKLVDIKNKGLNAVRDVLVNDHFLSAADRRIHCGQLHQNIRAVLVVFHHALYLLQVADDPGQPVDQFFLMLRRMIMSVIVHRCLPFRGPVPPGGSQWIFYIRAMTKESF